MKEHVMTAMQGRIQRWACCVAGAAAAAVLATTAPATAAALTAATARPADEILPLNPAAEAGPGAAGWSGTPGYTTTPYGAAGEFPSPAVSASIGSDGIIAGGSAFFDPGSEPNARLAQDVDLARFRSQIASGELNELWFVAWLGGYGSSPDTVDMLVTPFDASGQPLSAPARLAGPTAAERRNQTALVHRMGSAPAPPTTARARIELIATGQPGQKNHGYADEVILGLTHHSTNIGPDFGRARYYLPVVSFRDSAPTVSGRGARLRLHPRATITCPRASCTARIVARSSRAGGVIARRTLIIRAGQRVHPDLALTRRARAALARGRSLRTQLTVTATSSVGYGPVTQERTAVIATSSTDR